MGLCKLLQHSCPQRKPQRSYVENMSSCSATEVEGGLYSDRYCYEHHEFVGHMPLPKVDLPMTWNVKRCQPRYSQRLVQTFAAACELEQKDPSSAEEVASVVVVVVTQISRMRIQP